jgi:hypothetical protein
LGDERPIALAAMILKPSSVGSIAAKQAWADAVMLATDHAPEPRD